MISFGFIMRSSCSFSVDALITFNVDHQATAYYPGGVPFDYLAFNAVLFVIEKATNRSLPITAFAAGEGAENFVSSSSEMSATKSRFTYDSGAGPTTVEVDSRTSRIKAERSRLAKAFTICMLVVNTALAIGSTYITLLVVSRGGENEGSADGICLLPVTIILTVPAIRSLYVGAPPFGIYIGRPMTLGPQIWD